MNVQPSFSMSPNIAAQLQGMNWGDMSLSTKQEAKPANDDVAAAVESGLPAREGTDMLTQKTIEAVNHAGKHVEHAADAIGGALKTAGGSTSFSFSGGARGGLSASPVSVSYETDHSHTAASAAPMAKAANDIGISGINLSSLIMQNTDMGNISPTGHDGVAPRAVAGPIATLDAQLAAA